MSQPESYVGPSVLQLTEWPPNGCTLWRTFFPCEHLERARYMAHHAPLVDKRAGLIAQNYDAFVLPRVAWKLADYGEGERWFSAIHRAGKTAIYEADDDLFSPNIVARIKDTNWEDGRSDEVLEQDRLDRLWTLERCDGVTVSTRRLATIVRQYTDKPVKVVPNFIDVHWFREVLLATPREVEGLTIGWAGGRRPDRDVEPMAIAWGEIARRYKHVTFVIQGWQPGIFAEHVPEDRLVRLPWMPLSQYPSGLKQIDIGCCAVSDQPFNRAKTPIKAMEHAVAGAAVVATPLLYAQIVDHGFSGFLVETAEEWTDALSELIERPGLRSIMAKRLLRTVLRDHALDANLWRWPAAWLSIVNAQREREGRESYEQERARLSSLLWLPTPNALPRASGLVTASG